MKKVLGILLAVIFLTAGNAFAHCGKCGMGDDEGMDFKARAHENAGKMAKNLSLSEEQKDKVAAIFTEKSQRMHALMEEKRKDMEALHEEFQTKLKGVLTEEQMKKWEEKKAGFEGHCPMCKDGKMCEKCAMMKGKGGKCPESKDGKACAKCMIMKKGDCPACKDGKMCAKCEKMSESKCPKCKEGKMCKMCKIKKAKEGKDSK